MGKKLIAFKKKIGNKVNNLKKNFQNMKSGLKSRFRGSSTETETETQSMSKRKLALVGILAVVSIFGLTLFWPSLSAYAQNVPLDGPPKPTAPASPTTPKPGSGMAPPGPPIFDINQKKELQKSIGGAAAVVCYQAALTGNIPVSVACLVIVGVGIVLGR
jgi:hypothetical protein